MRLIKNSIIPIAAILLVVLFGTMIAAFAFVKAIGCLLWYLAKAVVGAFRKE